MVLLEKNSQFSMEIKYVSMVYENASPWKTLLKIHGKPSITMVYAVSKNTSNHDKVLVEYFYLNTYNKRHITHQYLLLYFSH